MTRDPLDDLRRRVLDVDRRIVGALNERLALVAEIWSVKTERGLPLLDEERERRLRAALAEANDGPLSAEGLDALVDAVLELTKREMGGGHVPGD